MPLPFFFPTTSHPAHSFTCPAAMPALSLVSVAVRRAAAGSAAPTTRLSLAAAAASVARRSYAVRAPVALTASPHGVRRVAAAAGSSTDGRRSYADVLPSSVRRLLLLVRLRDRGPCPPTLRPSLVLPAHKELTLAARLPPFSCQADLGKTPLHDYHVQKGAKMVPFAGYLMPLSYAVPPTSGLSPHAHVRTHAGLFDVGHMVQSYFRGPGAQAFLESLCPTDLGALGKGEGGLTVLLNKAGGIVDDTIVTKHDDETFYVVTNAGRRIEDLALFREQLADWGTTHGADQAVEFEVLDGWGLVALQGQPPLPPLLSRSVTGLCTSNADSVCSPGPKSQAVLQEHVDADLSTLYFGQSTFAQFDVPGAGATGAVRIHIARGGYTGEDGFEVSISAKDTVAVTDAIVRTPLEGADGAAVELIGLGARDSLRLEAGMCLYGHDLNEGINPVEAGLAWVISQSRRPAPVLLWLPCADPDLSSTGNIGKSRRAADAPPFPGKSSILAQLSPKTPPSRRRVGLVVKGAPAREGALIFPRQPAGGPVPAESEAIGAVTSGIPSPTTGQNIAMGYVGEAYKKAGTALSVLVRKKLRDAEVAKMPFTPVSYYRKPAAK